MAPSETTLKQYAARLKTLANAKVDPIGKPQSLLDWFAETKQGNSSQKAYISAVKNAFPDSFPSALQDELNGLYKKQNEVDKEQKLTKAQALHYMPWADILAVQTTLAAIKDKTPAQQKHLLVVSLYTLTPPVRADYGDVKIFKNKAMKTRPRTGNELIWTKKPVFVFREYKTAKSYGEVTLPIPKPLVKIIEDYFTFLGEVPKFLLGEEMSANTLSQYVQDVFRQYTGKEVGVSLLRHSYRTFRGDMSIAEKEVLARQMLHSATMGEQYRVMSTEEKKEQSK
jgi:hypothetical protein